MKLGKEKTRFVNLNTAFTSGVAIVTAGNGLYNSNQGPSTDLVKVYRTSVKLNPVTFTLTVGAGGENDAQGQKLWSWPEGFIDVQRVMLSGSVTPATGMSATSAVISMGTAAAASDNAALTSTEADILASTTLGDGTLASATAEALSVAGDGVAGILDGTATAKDAYLNIGGAWTKASGTTAALTVTDMIVICDWVWLGDD